MRTELNKTTTGVSGLRLPLILLLCVLASFFVYSSARAKTSSDFAKGVGFVSKQKSTAEGLVRMLEESYRDKEIEREDYKRGKRLYLNAQSAFNGWLNTLQTELIHDQNIDSSAAYTASLKEAAIHAETFKSHVDDLIFGDTLGADVGEIVAALIEPLANFGREIWQESRAADKEKTEKLIKKLEDLKWKTFNEIR